MRFLRTSSFSDWLDFANRGRRIAVVAIKMTRMMANSVGKTMVTAVLDVLPLASDIIGGR